MTTMDRKHYATLPRRVATLQQVWLREREERRVLRLMDNADVRRRWLKADSLPGEFRSEGPQREEDESVPNQT